MPKLFKELMTDGRRCKELIHNKKLLVNFLTDHKGGRNGKFNRLQRVVPNQKRRLR
jgi:hypothetical protein